MIRSRFWIGPVRVLSVWVGSGWFGRRWVGIGNLKSAGVAELADARGLGPRGRIGRAGSSPVTRISIDLYGCVVTTPEVGWLDVGVPRCLVVGNVRRVWERACSGASGACEVPMSEPTK